MASTSSFSAHLAERTAVSVEFDPAFIITFARFLFARLTVLKSSNSSSWVNVGPSPVVPATSRVSVPFFIRYSVRFSALLKSISLFELNGVIIAVITSPASYLSAIKRNPLSLYQLR